MSFLDPIEYPYKTWVQIEHLSKYLKHCDLSCVEPFLNFLNLPVLLKPQNLQKKCTPNPSPDSSLTPKPISRSFSPASFVPDTRTQKLERIADDLLDLTKFERHDYSILFRHKMGLHRYGPALSGAVLSGPAASGSGTADAKPEAEKTAFAIKLEKFDAAAKIKIIKEVRTFTDLGLKEAKELVEKVPVVLKKEITKEEANPIIDKLRELGASVVLE